MIAEVLTFGCRLNAYESEVMRDLTSRATPGGRAPPKGTLGDTGTDTIIVNTCAVTAEAERQARQAIRRAARERPGTRIVVTGCAAQFESRRVGSAAGRDAGARQPGQAEAGELGAGRALSGFRHHEGARHHPASGDRVRRAQPCLRAGATGMRPSLHVLHHPVRPRPLSQRAGGCGSGTGARPGAGGLPGGGADRRGHRILRHGSAGRPPTGSARAPAARIGAGAAAAAPVLPRSRRRSTTICGDCSRTSRG